MTPQESLFKHFNLKTFRHSQEAVVNAVLAREDVLVVMPTGGGKSLCYQLPSLMLEGITVVVSPLISLMQDQVNSLQALNIAATYVNSTLSLTEQNSRLTGIAQLEYKLVYVAPERFRSSRFFQTLNNISINFLAIDEAHCISQWGHDFRPDYLRIGEAINQLGRPPVAAFTATATPTVQEDIISSLHLKNPKKFVSGFSRPNLELKVVHANKDAEKFGHLSRLVENEKTGIIYCATRKRVEKVATKLHSWDCSLVAYHAGMSDDERKVAQNLFMQKKVDIAVATNAFGMGIDRSDIRFVAHFEIPGSLEAYYQEVGRAGRDGKGSTCEMYFSYADKRVQEFFIEGSNPPLKVIQAVYTQLQREANLKYEVYLSIDDLTERIGKGTNPMAVGTALSLLARAKCIKRFDISGARIKGTRLLEPDLTPYNLPLDYNGLKKKEIRDYEKLETVIRFAQGLGCREQWILNYFGEAESEPCRRCDQCCSGRSSIKAREANEEELLIVQKALSGIARMSWRDHEGKWIPRYGRGKIVQMLLGSQSQGIKSIGLDKLSTYGLLKELSTPYLNELFKQFEHNRLVVTSKDGKFPLITLTEKGNAIMRQQESLKIVWPNKPESEIKKNNAPVCNTKIKTLPENFDSVLYEALRQKRIEIAEKKRNARLFMVLNNRALEHLATLKPKSVKEAQEIPGIGPAKARTVLPHFIKVIQNFSSKKASDSSELLLNT